MIVINIYTNITQNKHFTLKNKHSTICILHYDYHSLDVTEEELALHIYLYDQIHIQKNVSDSLYCLILLKSTSYEAEFVKKLLSNKQKTLSSIL